MEQGPLFSDDETSFEADGERPPAVGATAGAAGAGGAAPSAPPPDAGLTASEQPPLPVEPIDAPAGCSRDGGAPRGCDERTPEFPEPENPCDACLADVCPADIQRCDDTEGCEAIVECARSSGCVQDECYCGTVNEFLCSTTGQANGPCRDVMLAAPGAHPPSLANPTAGPAAEAASAVGECRSDSNECRRVCSD